MDIVEAFVFDLKEQVKIAVNERIGKVVGQYRNEQGVQYCVEYAADDGVVHNTYFFGSQLVKAG